MLTLYEMYPTRSQRVKWMLEEIGAEYDSSIVDLRVGAHMQPEYQSVNPMETVPTITTPEYKIHESVAIVMQLADEHPEANLAPAVGSADRARYYQWCVFGCSEMDYPLGLVTQNEVFLPEDQRNKSQAESGRELFAKRAAVLSNALGKGPFLLGDQFTGADVVIGYDCFWSTFTGQLDQQPNLVAYLERLQARPAFQRAFAEPS